MSTANKRHSTRLFPYILLRISAGPIQEFTRLRLRHTLVSLTRLTELQNDINETKESLSQDLYALIAKCNTSDKRNVLLSLRRDIHNERLDSLPKTAKNLLSQAEKARVATYLKLYTQKHQLLKAGEASYNKEVLRNDKAFSKLLQAPNLQNGILLSSTALSEALKKFLPEAQQSLPKVERSLMKYMSRMYTKPSPFSTFTTLAVATLAAKAPPLKTIQRSHVELNRYIFHYVIGLLVQNKTVRGYLDIRLNPTIRFIEKQAVFICNNFNRESIQHIRLAPAMQVVYDIILANEPLTYNELIKRLSTGQPQHTSAEEIERYIDTLVSYGFLEFDVGILATDNEWDSKLTVFLEKLPKYSYLVDLQKTLRSLRKAKDKYDTKPPHARAALLDEAFAKLRQTCLQLHIAAGLPEEERASFIDTAGRLKEQAYPKNEGATFTFQYDTVFKLLPRDIWYEDAYLDTALLLPTETAEPLTLLGDLLSRLGWLDSCSESLYEITDFFKQRYQESARVDLLQFYEVYYREKHTEQKEDEQAKQATGPALEAFKKRKEQYLDEFMGHTKDRIDETGVLYITQRDVAHMERLGGSSFAAYVQLWRTPSGKHQLVVNSTTPGYGKMISRFLPLFEQEVTDAFRTWNEKSADDYAALFAESTDASAFNANMHPSLMPYAATSSGSYTPLPPERQIPVTNIEIGYQKHSGRVSLYQKNDDREIFSFDLAFQSVTGRATLFEFLSNFTPSPHRHPGPLLTCINSEVRRMELSGPVVILPRVVYEHAVVLQRKTWELPRNQLPFRSPTQSDWDYFRYVATWRQKLGLPDEVFVKNESEKPQYIDFASPLLIHLLEKIFEKASKSETILIEEMLPNTSQLLAPHGKQAVTEFLTHWYD